MLPHTGRSRSPRTSRSCSEPALSADAPLPPPSRASPPAPAVSGNGHPTVAVIGDSIESGAGLRPAEAWPALVAVDRQWSLENYSAPGAGFVAHVGDEQDPGRGGPGDRPACRHGPDRRVRQRPRPGRLHGLSCHDRRRRTAAHRAAARAHPGLQRAHGPGERRRPRPAEPGAAQRRRHGRRRAHGSNSAQPYQRGRAGLVQERRRASHATLARPAGDRGGRARTARRPRLIPHTANASPPVSLRSLMAHYAGRTVGCDRSDHG